MQDLTHHLGAVDEPGPRPREVGVGIDRPHVGVVGESSVRHQFDSVLVGRSKVVPARCDDHYLGYRRGYRVPVESLRIGRLDCPSPVGRHRR